MNTNEHRKISFQLVIDEDDYPPIPVESLWAVPEGENYRIDSVPFFTSSATVGDLVSVSIDHNGTMWFDAVLTSSANSLIRVVFFDQSASPEVQTQIRKFGCGFEIMQQFNLLAIDIPIGVDIEALKAYLVLMANESKLDFEEAILRA